MSIIASLISLAILVIKKIVGKKLSPTANYFIWLVFIIALIFPIAIPSKISIYNVVPIENMKYKTYQEKTSAVVNLENYNYNKVLMDYMKGTRKNNTKIKRNSIRNWIAYIWFMIFLVKLVQGIRMYLENYKTMGNDKIEDERANLILEKCKKKLKIKRKIYLVRQNAIYSPAILGVFKIKILINDKILELDDVYLMNTFMHELSHYKRKDNVVNVVIIILKSIYFFNPLILYSFYEIRKNMEFATDEMAISKMSKEERIDYCKLMIMIASKFKLKQEEMLGLSGSAKYLEERIAVIGNKQYFSEKSKRIALVTMGIVLFMLVVLYPTSYGIFANPEIHLELEDGTKIVLDNQSDEIRKITVDKESEIKVIVEESKPNTKVFYSILNLNTNQLNNRSININKNKISYFEEGDYIYTFIFNNGNNKEIEYPIEILVE